MSLKKSGRILKLWSSQLWLRGTYGVWLGQKPSRIESLGSAPTGLRGRGRGRGRVPLPGLYVCESDVLF